MHSTRNYGSLLLGFVMILVGSACATNDGDTKDRYFLEIDFDKRSDEDDASAGDGLWAVQAYNSAVHAAVTRGKADGEKGPFALYNAIHAELARETAGRPLLEKAAEQVLEQMLVTEDDRIAANVYGFLVRFAELSSVPRESLPEAQVSHCWTDSFNRKSEIEQIVRYGDEDAKRAYHFAAAYNVVLNTQVFLFSLDDRAASDFDLEYMEALEINSKLVGAGRGDPGTLSDWIARETPGNSSASMKNEKNVVVETLRLAIEEQTRLLE